MANVLAFAESRGGTLRKSALEAVTAARRIADARGVEVHAVLAGAAGIAAQAEQLGKFGADVVLVAEHEGFAHYNPEATALPRTEQGRVVGRRVAARGGVAMASAGTGFGVEPDAIVCSHPVNIGKVIASLRVTGTPAIISVRPSAFTPAESPRQARVES